MATADLSAEWVLAHLIAMVLDEIRSANAYFALGMLQICAKYSNYIHLFIANAHSSTMRPGSLPEVRDCDMMLGGDTHPGNLALEPESL